MKKKRLVLRIWKDFSVFALAVAMFAHLYYIWYPSWWTVTWDVCWVAAYVVSIAYLIKDD